MSFDDVVTTLDKTAVVAIVTTRAKGETTATAIWSMVVDGVPYVRSAFGPGSWWYRHVLSGRPVAFVIGDGSIAERDKAAALELPREQVSLLAVPVDDPVQDDIDTEILSKYTGAPRSSVDAMVSEEARACTLRVEGVA